MSIDVIGLIETFNLVVLPPSVAGVVIAALLVRRRPPAAAPGARGEDAAAETLRLARLDRERTVRRVGLLNYGIAARALVQVVPQVQEYLVLGNHWSIPVLDLGLPLIVVVANVPIGLGLRRLRTWARWAEVVWNILVAVVALPVSVWLWRLGAAVEPSEWPEIAVAKVLPVFLVVVMLLPGTAKVVSAAQRDLIARTPRVAAWPARRSVVAALTLGFLVVLGAVVVVDALDWVARVRFEVGAIPAGLP